MARMRRRGSLRIAGVRRSAPRDAIGVRAVVGSMVVCLAAVGCGGEGRAATRPSNIGRDRPEATTGTRDGRQVAQGGQDSGVTGRAPTLVAHPEDIQAGLAPTRRLLTVQNPREHDARALEEGKQLFISYNCTDCHGSEGSGAVGPSLQAGRWHFGGTAGEVYESIAEGRPDGMPSWGGRISEEQIWALVTYVRSLSANANVATENFEGKTVPRGGH